MVMYLNNRYWLLIVALLRFCYDNRYIFQVRRFLGKKKTDIVPKKINNEVDYQDGIVRVDAPQFRISGIPLFLSDSTTVGDVILK